MRFALGVGLIAPRFSRSFSTMHRLSKRFLSATLRSSGPRQRDAAAAISFSNSMPIGEGIDDSRMLKLLSSIQSLEASGIRTLHSQASNNTLWRSILPYISQGSSSRREWLSFGVCRSFCHGRESDPLLDRNFLARLWVADKKMERAREKRKRKRKVVKYRNDLDNAYDNQSFFQNPTGRWFSGTAAAGEDHYDRGKPTVKQPPVSQSMSGYLEPTSPEEAQVAPLLARSNLLITRDIEWANLVLGFEQENRYAVVDVCYPQAPAGFIREQSNVIARQLLRLRRPFVAYITDALGNELFRVRRPFWWITSSIYAEINGKEIGVVHRRWHLWRRIYDLYLGNKQFAVVENPGFWNWTFTMKDIDGEVLAQIDRDWRGFGFEIFTDAGQYVIRFGKSDATSKTGAAAMIEEMEVKRPLSLSERAIAVALAISLDNDYFSRHGGWGIPFIAVEE